MRNEAEYFPAFENSEQSFRIVFFSATPTEIEAFQKGNEAQSGALWRGLAERSSSK